MEDAKVCKRKKKGNWGHLWILWGRKNERSGRGIATRGKLIRFLLLNKGKMELTDGETTAKRVERKKVDSQRSVSPLSGLPSNKGVT